MFPNLLVSTTSPSYNLTIYNSCSSNTTLGLMRWIAFLGMPFVLSYTAVVYWVFRGKVKLEKTSY
jgi:cytochrome d ubiquinol oxidase subunit II